MNYNDEELFQLEWIENHHIEDKDESAEKIVSSENFSHSKRLKKKKGRNPSSWKIPIPEDEIDLHGMSAEEAYVSVEQRIEQMQMAGLKVLRIIHGGGNPTYGNVKKIIDKKVRSEWRHVVEFYKTEIENAGSSILIITGKGAKKGV